MSIGFDLESSQKSVELSEKIPLCLCGGGSSSSGYCKYSDEVEKELENGWRKKGDDNRRNRLRLSLDGRSEGCAGRKGLGSVEIGRKNQQACRDTHQRGFEKTLLIYWQNFLVLKGYCIVTGGHMKQQNHF